MNAADIRDLVKQANEPPHWGRPREEELVTKPRYLLAAEALRKWWTQIDVRGPDECWPVIPAPYRQRHIRCEIAYYLMTGQTVHFTSLQPLCQTFACCNPDHHKLLPDGQRRQATPENWLTDY